MNVPKPLIPKEHGSWSVLFVPLLAGAGIAGKFDLKIIFLLLSVFFLYLGYYSCLSYFRWRNLSAEKLGDYLFWSFIYSAFAFLFSLYLLIQYQLGLLVPFGFFSILFLCLQIIQALHKKERTISGEFSGVLALTFSAPLSYYVSTGIFNQANLSLWFLNFLFFGRSIFYVKMKVKANSVKESLDSLNKKFYSGKEVLLYLLLMFSGVFFLTFLHLAPIFSMLAFVPATFYTLGGILRLGRKIKMKNLGFMEMANSLAFALILILTFSKK